MGGSQPSGEGIPAPLAHLPPPRSAQPARMSDWKKALHPPGERQKGESVLLLDRGQDRKTGSFHLYDKGHVVTHDGRPHTVVSAGQGIKDASRDDEGSATSTRYRQLVRVRPSTDAEAAHHARRERIRAIEAEFASDPDQLMDAGERSRLREEASRLRKEEEAYTLPRREAARIAPWHDSWGADIDGHIRRGGLSDDDRASVRKKLFAGMNPEAGHVPPLTDEAVRKIAASWKTKLGLDPQGDPAELRRRIAGHLGVAPPA
jgi:hypothetical protein